MLGGKPCKTRTAASIVPRLEAYSIDIAFAAFLQKGIFTTAFQSHRVCIG
jgi:hypothetical protein